MRIDELPAPLRIAVEKWRHRVVVGWDPSRDGRSVFEADLVELARALLVELDEPTEPRDVGRVHR